jgi:hypothetical protein
VSDGSVTVSGGSITLVVETGFLGISLRRGREEQLQRRGLVFVVSHLAQRQVKMGTR